MAKDYGFEPNGLPGWHVFIEKDKFGSRWVFSTPADFPRTFDWSEETKSHSVPVYDDWRGPFSGPECKTAKQAVAAAHRHNEVVTRHLNSLKGN